MFLGSGSVRSPDCLGLLWFGRRAHPRRSGCFFLIKDLMIELPLSAIMGDLPIAGGFWKNFLTNTFLTIHSKRTRTLSSEGLPVSPSAASIRTRGA